MHNHPAHKNAFSSVFFLIALFLITSMQSQLGQILLNSSRIMHSKKMLMKDKKKDEEEMLSILHNQSEPFSPKTLTDRYAVMTSHALEISNRRNIPIHIQANSVHNPILWRKFLSMSGTLEECNVTPNSECAINSVTIPDIVKVSQEKLVIKDTLLSKFSSSPLALGVSGELTINNLVLKGSDEQINQERKLLLLAAFESITIQHIDFEGSSLKYFDIVLYTAQGNVTIESTPPHRTCMDQNHEVPGLYIIARETIIDGNEIDSSHYACIPHSAKDWFPEKKMVGFVRLEP